MKQAIIFIDGNLSNLSRVKKIITKKDCLIAVDGGVRHILKLDLIPHIIIGDLDSTLLSLQKKLKNFQIKWIKYPTNKDKTDFELAIDLVFKRKYQQIIIVGILGDRIDHLLANILLLAKVQTENKLVKIKIIEGNKEIFILNKEIVINGKIGDEVSIIPINKKLEGVVTEGLAYKLNDELLPFGSTKGVSNVMNKSVAKISVKKGVALIEHNLQ
jgi:thiamine pyrophosphokinase